MLMSPRAKLQRRVDESSILRSWAEALSKNTLIFHSIFTSFSDHPEGYWGAHKCSNYQSRNPIKFDRFLIDFWRALEVPARLPKLVSKSHQNSIDLLIDFLWFWGVQKYCKKQFQNQIKNYCFLSSRYLIKKVSSGNCLINIINLFNEDDNLLKIKKLKEVFNKSNSRLEKALS